jgi:monovalent cation/hydrogen antiporter
MHDVELVLVSLLVAVAGLAAAARAADIPYPIVRRRPRARVRPRDPRRRARPRARLVLFLAPLLYSVAFFANLLDLRRVVRPISLVAIELVLATMCAAAIVAHELIDGMSWAAAFTLGAIVAPTDPIAAAATALRQNAPRRSCRSSKARA